MKFTFTTYTLRTLMKKIVCPLLYLKAYANLLKHSFGNNVVYKYLANISGSLIFTEISVSVQNWLKESCLLQCSTLSFLGYDIKLLLRKALISYLEGN